MRVQASGSTPATQFPEGVLAWNTINAVATGSDLPCSPITLDLELHDDRYVCVTIHADDGLTGEMLRQIPVAEIVRRAVSDSLDQLKPSRDGGFSIVLGAARPPKPTGRTGPSDDLLRHVAFVYRVALLAGDAPTEAVAKEVGIPRATAGRWIASAREKGFLIASAPRRPE